MQYQVPQFIEVEDKIFGPLSLRQFIYIAGGIGIVTILITLLPLFFGIIASIPVAMFSAALAFYKVNNRSFVDVLESSLFFFFNDKLYIWQKREGKAAQKKEVVPEPSEITLPQEGNVDALQKIHNLALSLDVEEPNIYGR